MDFIFLFKTESYVAQVGLKLTMWPKITGNSCPSSPYLLSAKTVTSYHSETRTQGLAR